MIKNKQEKPLSEISKLNGRIRDLKRNIRTIRLSIYGLKVIKELQKSIPERDLERKKLLYKPLYKKNTNNINFRLKNNSKVSFRDNLESKHFPSSVRE